MQNIRFNKTGEMSKMTEKKAQVWIETVIYILIGLAIIALILTFVVPKINEQKDIAVVEQSIASLQVLDDTINDVISKGKDNKRVVEFKLSRGELYFNVTGNEENKIYLIINGLTKPYSEPNEEINFGRIKIKTREGKKTSSVSLTLNYTEVGVVLTFNDDEKNAKFTPSSTPYKFIIENKGIAKNVFSDNGVEYDAHKIDIKQA